LKSKAARRDIPIPKRLVDWLVEEKSKQKKASGGKNPDGYVVCMDDGSPMTQSAFRSAWGYITRRQVGTARRMRKDEKGELKKIKVSKRIWRCHT
jgi:hypothetical protein